MNFFLDYKRPFLIVVILITIFLGIGLSMVGTDFSFDSFFPRDDNWDFYQEYRQSFPNETNIYFIALENNGKDVLDPEFLEVVDSLFLQVGRLDNVDTVFSPISVPWLTRTPGGVKSRPLVDYSSPEALEKTRSRLDADTVLAQNFFTADLKVICGIIAMNDSILDLPARDVLSNKLQGIVDGLPYKGIVSGVPCIRTGFVEKIAFESSLFISLSVILTLIVLILTYRSFWGVVVPMIGVLVTVVWCMGIMGWIGKNIDLMFMLLPTIMFVVATSSLIHIVTKYIQELQTGKTRIEAMKSTIKKIGAAVLLTNVTTAIGFASLTVSKIPPMRDFGIFAAIGVMVAFVVAMVVGPNILPAISSEKLANTKGVGNLTFWERMLERLNAFVKIKRNLILAAFGGVVALSIYGMTLVSFNSYLLEDIKEGDKIRTNLEFLEDKFYGISPLEIAILMKDGNKVTDLKVLEEIEKIEAFAKTQNKISPFLSPVTLMKNANRLNHFGREKYYTLPKSQEKVDEVISFAIVSGGGEVLKTVMNEDYSLGRISARMKDVGTDNFHKLNEAIVDYAKHNTDTTKFSVRMTGTAVLAEQNVVHFRQALFNGLLLAFSLVGLIMGLLFRSWKMTIVALIPNLIPVLFTAGVMGLLGRSLTTSASIVFVVSFGIAVDDTIHFLSRFRQERALGASVNLAIRNTLVGTGKALIITTLILTGGFVLLTLSSFGGVFVVGLFVCLTLVMGLLSDLLLMPVLVRWVYKDPPPQKKTETPSEN